MKEENGVFVRKKENDSNGEKHKSSIKMRIHKPIAIQYC
jgi:hypothetical protein